MTPGARRTGQARAGLPPALLPPGRLDLGLREDEPLLDLAADHGERGGVDVRLREREQLALLPAHVPLEQVREPGELHPRFAVARAARGLDEPRELRVLGEEPARVPRREVPSEEVLLRAGVRPE